jgi:hypothetical protein
LPCSFLILGQIVEAFRSIGYGWILSSFDQPQRKTPHRQIVPRFPPESFEGSTRDIHTFNLGTA